MNKDQIPQSYYEIIEACAEPGCPLCRLVEDLGFKFLVAGMHGTATDPDTRLEYQKSMGFCNRHAWLLPYTSGGARLGIAIFYQDYVKQVEKTLGKARYNASGGLSLNRVQETLNRKKSTTATETVVNNLQPQKPCPACEQEFKLETLALTTLTDFFPDDDRLHNALKESDGLCVPHLRRALALVRDEATFDALVEMTREKLLKLSDELSEFIRKHDHRYKNEKFAAEGNSWQRAITQIIGMPAPNPDRRKAPK
jgi:hypothetical protein